VSLVIRGSPSSESIIALLLPRAPAARAARGGVGVTRLRSGFRGGPAPP
jgi:hypothetical protein